MLINQIFELLLKNILDENALIIEKEWKLEVSVCI